MRDSDALWRVLGLFVLALWSRGCIYDGLVYEDGTGVSRGPSRFGVLYNGARLPAEGRGLVIPERWVNRGLNYGVEELVSVLVYAGRSVDMQMPGRVVAVGDMSRSMGGRSQWHRSHQTGRDADLLFMVRDKKGKPVVPDNMFEFEPDGKQRVAEGEEPALFFDVDANWNLVRILLDNPIADIQYIFIQDDLRLLLLDHALAIGESRGLIARAAEVLHQPSDSAPHDDHLHVRIYCPQNDLDRGCVDFGQMRWHANDLKYRQRAERAMPYDSLIPPGLIHTLPTTPGW